LCPKCGTEIQDEAKLCDDCWRLVAEADTAEKKLRKSRFMILVGIIVCSLLMVVEFFRVNLSGLILMAVCTAFFAYSYRKISRQIKALPPRPFDVDGG